MRKSGERILKVEESNLLFNKLYERKGLNSFNEALLGLCSGAGVTHACIKERPWRIIK